MSASDWMAIANFLVSVVLVAMFKPINDLRREIGSLKVTLHKDFVTYERLEMLETLSEKRPAYPRREARSQD